MIIASDGTQIINMKVTSFGYQPNAFTIEAGNQQL